MDTNLYLQAKQKKKKRHKKTTNNKSNKQNKAIPAKQAIPPTYQSTNWLKPIARNTKYMSTEDYFAAHKILCKPDFAVDKPQMRHILLAMLFDVANADKDEEKTDDNDDQNDNDYDDNDSDDDAVMQDTMNDTTTDNSIFANATNEDHKYWYDVVNYQLQYLNAKGPEIKREFAREFQKFVTRRTIQNQTTFITARRTKWIQEAKYLHKLIAGLMKNNGHELTETESKRPLIALSYIKKYDGQCTVGRRHEKNKKYDITQCIDETFVKCRCGMVMKRK